MWKSCGLKHPQLGIVKPLLHVVIFCSSSTVCLIKKWAGGSSPYHRATEKDAAFHVSVVVSVVKPSSSNRRREGSVVGGWSRLLPPQHVFQEESAPLLKPCQQHTARPQGGANAWGGLSGSGRAWTLAHQAKHSWPTRAARGSDPVSDP